MPRPSPALALAMIAAPAALHAAPVTLPFAPPLDTPLRYETVQTRDFEGKPQRFTMMQELSFRRAAGGYLLGVRLVDAHADADPRLASLFDAGMQPFMGVVIPIRVSAEGRPIAVIDRDQVWAQVVAALENVSRTIVQERGDTPMAAAIRRFFESFAAMPPAAREAKLMESANQILGFGRPRLAPGQRQPYAADAGSPFGGAPIRISGTLGLAGADAAAAHYVIETATSAGDMARVADAMAARMTADADFDAKALAAQRAALRSLQLGERTEIAMSRVTGLLIAATTVKTSAAGAGRPVTIAEETTRAIPAEAAAGAPQAPAATGR